MSVPLLKDSYLKKKQSSDETCMYIINKIPNDNRFSFKMLNYKSLENTDRILCRRIGPSSKEVLGLWQ